MIFSTKLILLICSFLFITCAVEEIQTKKYFQTAQIMRCPEVDVWTVQSLKLHDVENCEEMLAQYIIDNKSLTDDLFIYEDSVYTFYEIFKCTAFIKSN